MSNGKDAAGPYGGLRGRTHEIIYEADTPAGKFFDLALILCILASVLVVMLESVAAYQARWGQLFFYLEVVFTLLFTLEYLLRLWCVRRPLRYARSFFGVVDLLAILPTYLEFLLPGSHYFIVLRILRVLRIFRVLKLVPYVGEAERLVGALQASRQKILVFLLSVSFLMVIIGALMYLVEGERGGFDNIPISVYWAVVTITTVGYGDISPQTPLGQTLAALAMLLGYAIIAVPTGIVSAEYIRWSGTGSAVELSTQACPGCGRGGHDADARHCKHCGATL